MLKQLKPGRYYIVVNLDEPYAKDVFEVLKYGQQQKNEWPEGDIDFLSWVWETFRPTDEAEAATEFAGEGIGTPNRVRYSLLDALTTQVQQLEQKVERLREAGQKVCDYWLAGDSMMDVVRELRQALTDTKEG